MAGKRKALGRSFDTLLSSAGSPTPERGDALKTLPVDLIQRGKYQPRIDMHADTLQELADSIKAQGVVQPIVVRPFGRKGEQTQYEIIAGERRWRAAQLAGLHEIPAVVRDVPDRAAIAMALIENIQRENLNPLEEARALERLIDEFEMTHEQAAEAVGRSRAAVSNLLRLLELGPVALKLVEEGKLEMGHARALLGLKGALQDEAARMVAMRGLSVREAEALVRRQVAGTPAAPAPRLDPDIRRLQTELGDRLGARVEVKPGPKGKGKLVINYTSLDELDGIIERIR